MEFKVNIARKKYLVYIDTDDRKVIRKFQKEWNKANRWWKFNNAIIVPEGCVKVYKL